jgi:hypothetical protein
MAQKATLKTRILMKADTSENWSKAENFSPLEREPIFYTDTGEIKLGDGETNVNALPTFIKDVSDNVKVSGNKVVISSDKVTEDLKVEAGNATIKNTIIAQSAVIGEGEVLGKGGLAGGTTDTSGLGELGSGISVTKAKAEGDMSLAFGANSNAIAAGTMSIGANVLAGYKAYYWDAIDVNAKTITLSTTRKGLIGNPTYPSTIEGWQVGDTVTVVNKDNYVRCATITKIEGNKLTLSNMPAENRYTTAEILLGYGGSPTARTIVNNDRPDKGVVALGFGAVAIGGGQNKNTTAQGMFAYAFGYENQVASNFGFVAGRENTVGYASVAFGYNNTAGPAYSTTFGSSNKNDGYYTLVNGYQSEAKGQFSLINGRGLKSSTDYQTIVGRYNVEDTNALLLVGMGTDDSSRKNALTVTTQGDIYATRNIYSNGNKLPTLTEIDSNYLSKNDATAYYLAKSEAANTYLNRSIVDQTNSNITDNTTCSTLKINSQSTAFGSGSIARNFWASAFGTGSIANSNSQFVVGRYNLQDMEPSTDYTNNRRFGDYAFIIGNGSTDAARSNALTVDWNGNTKVSGKLYMNTNPGTELGRNNEVATLSAIDSIITRDSTGVIKTVHDAKDTCAYSFTSGDSNTVTSKGGTAFGFGNEATNFWATAVGSYAKAHSNSSFAAGNRVTTSSNVDGQIVLGKYNVIDDDAQLIVGCGDSSKSKNALVVKKSGDVYVDNIYATGESGNQINLRSIYGISQAAAQDAWSALENIWSLRGDLETQFSQLGNVMKFCGAVTKFSNIETPEVGNVVVFLTDYYITDENGEQELIAAAGSEWVYVQTKEGHYESRDDGTGMDDYYPPEYDWIKFGTCDALQAIVSQIDVEVDSLGGRIASLEQETANLNVRATDHEDGLRNFGDELETLKTQVAELKTALAAIGTISTEEIDALT